MRRQAVGNDLIDGQHSEIHDFTVIWPWQRGIFCLIFGPRQLRFNVENYWPFRETGGQFFEQEIG